MVTVHIWESNFRNYTVDAPAGSTYTYTPPAHPGYRLNSVQLGNVKLAAPYSFVVPASYIDLTAEFVLDTPDIPPPPPPPPPATGGDGYKEQTKVGPRCTVLQKGIGAQEFLFLRNDVTGELSPGYTTMTALYSGGYRTQFQCDAPLPPTPQQWQQSVSDALGRFFQGVTGTLGELTSGLADLRKDLDGIWDKLESWLVERIVRILIAGLDREVEMRGKNGRT